MKHLSHLAGGTLQYGLKSFFLTPCSEQSAGGMFASWVAYDNLHTRPLVEPRWKWMEMITRPFKIEYAGDWQE